MINLAESFCFECKLNRHSIGQISKEQLRFRRKTTVSAMANLLAQFLYHIVIYFCFSPSMAIFVISIMNHDNPDVLSKKEFEALSEFRFQMRRFERFSEDLVQSHGITPLQYLLLLHIKGYPSREYATVGELAVRLQAKHHGVVALISRCEASGLVQRRQSEIDRRHVEVVLLEEGEHMLTQLAALHRAELQSLNGVFPIPLINF
jgi:DNA-binding MarR family transcriptional regulator